LFGPIWFRIGEEAVSWNYIFFIFGRVKGSFALEIEDWRKKLVYFFFAIERKCKGEKEEEERFRLLSRNVAI